MRVHRWRSLLIVLLVAWPVAAVVAGSVAVQSQYPTRAEAAARLLGTTQAEVAWLPRVAENRVCPQWPTSLGPVHCDEAERIVVRDAPRSLADVLPGYRSVGVRIGSVAVLRRFAGGHELSTRVDATVVDLAAPEFAGRWDLVAGRAATGTEVVVSRPLARAFGVDVGEELGTAVGRFVVAGVVTSPEVRSPAVFLPPGHPLVGDVTEERLFLVGERPIGWDEVQRLNRRGVQVLSRALVLDPPFDSASSEPTLQLVGLAGALGGLMVMFVAGSAFAVGVRTSRRQLGLLGAVGAPDAVLRRLVLAQAVWLAGIGALLGVAAGLGIGRLGSLWLAADERAPLWGFHVPWQVVVPTALIGVLACTLAAWGPARTVMKVDALEAVRSADVTTPAVRVPWLGGVLTLLGLGLMAWAVVSFRDDSRPWWSSRPELVTLVIVGVCALTAGVALSLHPVIALAARWVPRRPLAVRLAVRDIDRSRARVVPAVAAVVTATTLTTVVVAIVAGVEEGVRAHAAWRTHPTHAVLHLVGDARDPDVAVDAAELALGVPVTAATLPTRQASLATPAANACPESVGPPEAGDWRCGGAGPSAYPELVVGDIAELRILLGRDPRPDELADLRGGVLLASSRRAVADGTALVLRGEDAEGDPATSASRAVPVAARWIEVPEVAGWSIVSPARADALGLAAGPDAVVLDVGRRLTPAENDRLDAVLADVGFWSRQVPRSPDEQTWSAAWFVAAGGAVVVLAVVGLVTALGVADARRDEATLASIGAPPRLRRATTAGQVLVVSGLGCLVGAGIGVLGIAALIHTQPVLQGGPVVPWLHVAALVVGLPLTGALLAWLVTPPSAVAARRLLT